MSMGQCHFRAILFLFFIVITPIRFAAAEDGDLARWMGLWCSGTDEIGIFPRTDLGHSAEGETAPLYLYVHRYMGEADASTLQGFANPNGDHFELADGECRIRAEMKDARLVITDNQRCNKISGVFHERRFTRMRERIAFGGPWRKQPHCPRLTDDR
ncbi:MAG: hypothetical protein F8N37_08875 [Telmatospirillum sp.]|nr:hypothetical protein [Telmatospirillum sp.]